MSGSPSDAPPATWPPPDPLESHRREPAAAGRDTIAVLGVYLLMGVAAGVLWWLLVDPAQFTKARNGGLGMGEVELGKRFSDDGWFAVIAAVLGLLSGAGITWWRSRDSLLTAGLVLVGAALAGWVMAGVGGLLGPPDPEVVAAATAVGGTIPVSLEVTGFVCYLVWPITSLAGVLLVLWSPAPEPTTSADG